MPDADRPRRRWGGEVGGGASPSPAPPPGTGGGNPATTTGPSGQLWHNNGALDVVTGTPVANLDNSPPTLVNSDCFAMPWPDVSQYVVSDSRPSRGETTITVKEAGTRRAPFELIYGGYAGSPQPSSASKKAMLMTVGDSSVGPADYGFINPRTRSSIERFSPGGARNATSRLPPAAYRDTAKTWGRTQGAQTDGSQESAEP